MLAKATILSIPDKNSNKFTVQIPMLNKAGRGDKGTIMEAIMCFTPGNLYGYEPGDVVIVGFEQNLMNKPIILGLMYKKGHELKYNNYTYSNNLNINEHGKARLPADTELGGLKVSTLMYALRELDAIKNYVINILDIDASSLLGDLLYAEDDEGNVSSVTAVDDEGNTSPVTYSTEES